MEYLITNIESEKCQNGKITLYAVADDNAKTSIVISYYNDDLVSLNKKSIKILLNKEYNRIKQSKERYLPKIGEIL